MKKIFYILLLLLPFQAFAQQHLAGIINDEQGKPLDAATVTISQNGSVVSTQLADFGKFTLTGLNQSAYQLSVSLIGYKTLIRSFNLPKDSLNLTLLNDKQQLKEVAIVFKKPIIERQIDRVVFNVENSIMASGGNVWDALTKAPGVQTTNEGAVKANNKGATIYMDGKPVRLSGDDLTAYLQSIPSDQISKIEVMPTPSAKYEAQGGAVINIVSKKIKAEGFNVNLSGGYTRRQRNSYTGNTLFNYRKNKLNVFGSYGYSDRELQRDLSNYTIYQTPESYAYWDMNRLSLNRNKVSNYTAGVDYNLDSKQVFGLLITGNNSASTSQNNGITNIYNNHRSLADSLLHTHSISAGNTNQYSFNANYKIQFDSTGRGLNVDLNYDPYSKDNTQNLENLSYLPDGSLASALYKVSAPSTQKIDIWSGKVDYSYKLGKIWTMESGLKYTSIVTKNLFDFFNVAGPVPELDLSKSDQFKYTENTGAAYTDIQGVVGKWSFKGGLRVEYTQTKGQSLSLDSVTVNNYLRIFPTVYINYKSSENSEFGVNYSKRIDRPDYAQLNPAKRYSSPYNYQNGNPFLRPAIFNNLEFNYVLNTKYTFAAVLRQIDDLSSNVPVQDNINKTFYDTQLNIGRIREVGTELSSVNRPASWWEMNNTAQGYYRKQNSDQPGNSYNYQQFYFYLRTDNAFTLDKNSGLKAELSAWYNSRVQQGTLSVDRTYDLSAGISKPVFNKQGTLRFTAADILYGNPYRITINNAGTNNGFYQKNDTRAFTLSFSYKLGSNVTAARKRATGSEEEQKRRN